MRRTPSPNIISLYSSLAVAIFSTAIFLSISFIFFSRINIMDYVVFPLTIFSVTFFLFRFVLVRFIYSKIKIIYKTIGKPLKFQTEMRDGSNNVMKTVERDVAEWAINKNKQIRELRKMEQYRKEFVGNVSHELKTPIFNAQGYIETVLESDLTDHNFIKQYLEKANSNIERLETIVNDLLEISKFETGRIQLEKEPFDLVKLFKKVIFQYQHIAQQDDVAITIHSEENTIFVFADQKRIMQVLENLISNSIKYGREGGKIDINFYDLDEQFLVEIADNGPGIREEDITRIFERFYRADKSRSKKVGGTGLGLSIVKNIIEAHEQTINVRSEIDKGTTFSFTLQKYIPE
ncbi:MAG: histidine kinase [Bacteroidota bacterium]|nr:histidine kinase [Bacteroidota bacterium]